ncbi:hypothetical protein [Tessaracoccus coleopterorum]|uniref:hypothetical protein n=1 Tax=Tessaracoccus coleopterorum TaxID=2714950 RepID=UPI001E31C01E|nr:hypothetical protein [Tessaracoccus coleopterorum]
MTSTSPWHDLDTFVTTPRLAGLTLSHDGTTLIAAVQGPDAEKTAYTTSLWSVDITGERRAVRRTRSVKARPPPRSCETGRWCSRRSATFPPTAPTSPRTPPRRCGACPPTAARPTCWPAVTAVSGRSSPTPSTTPS